MPLQYAIGLLILFYILLVGEFFLPTGGLMGVAAVVSAIAAIAVAFTHSTTAGADHGDGDRRDHADRVHGGGSSLAPHADRASNS